MLHKSKLAETQRTVDSAFEIAYENYNNFKILHDRLIHHGPDFLDKFKLFTQSTNVVETDLFEFFVTGGRNPLKNIAQTVKAGEDQILIGEVERLIAQARVTLLKRLDEMATLITAFDERIKHRSRTLEELDLYLAKVAKKSKKVKKVKKAKKPKEKSSSSSSDDEFGIQRHQELMNAYAQANEPLKRDLINLWADRAQFFNPLVNDFAGIQTGIGKLFLNSAQLNTAIGTPGVTEANLHPTLQQFGLGNVITPTTGVMDMGARHSDQQWDVLSNLLANPQQPGPVLAGQAPLQSGPVLGERVLPTGQAVEPVGPLGEQMAVLPQSQPVLDERAQTGIPAQLTSPFGVPPNIAFERENTVPVRDQRDLALPLQRDLVVGGDVAYDRPMTGEHMLGEQRITGDGRSALPMTGEQRNFGVRHATVPLADDTATPLTGPHMPMGAAPPRTGAVPLGTVPLTEPRTLTGETYETETHDKHDKAKHDKHDKHDATYLGNVPLTGDIQRDFQFGQNTGYAPIIDEARRELGQSPNIGQSGQGPYIGQSGQGPYMGQSGQGPYIGQSGQSPYMGQQNVIPTMGQTTPLMGKDFGMGGRIVGTTPATGEINRDFGVAPHEEVGQPKRLFGLADDVNRNTFTSKVISEGESTKETYSR